MGKLEWATHAGVPFLTDRSEERVRVAFTGRHGGTSKPPRDTLNLSPFIGDDDGSVAANLGRAAALVEREAPDVAYLRQVHGRDVHRHGGGGACGEGDAVVATGSVAPMVLTADCVPVLLLGDAAVAAVHAGWRGLVAGVIEAAAREVGQVLKAWVGPSIKGCCYEVGPEVTLAFEERGLPVESERRVDTGDAARAALRSLGAQEIVAAGLCTSCDDRFFSYRRDGTTGRQGGLIALR